MTDHNQPFDLQKGRQERDDVPHGEVALGTDGQTPTQNTNDAPTEGSVPGTLAPEPAPRTGREAPQND